MKVIPIVDLTGVSLLQGRLTANTNGIGVDVKAYDGAAVAVVAVANTAGTNPTCDIAFTESDTQGGTYAAHSPARAITQVGAASSVQVVSLGDIAEWKRWLRAEFTIGGTSTPTYDVAAVLVAALKYN